MTTEQKNKRQLLKKLLGRNLYDNLRTRYLFRETESPFPLHQEQKFDPRWDEFVKPQVSRKEKMIYLVSPTQRSGTNFLSHILEKHPDIGFPKGEEVPNEHCLYAYSEFLKTYSQKTVSAWSKWIEGGEEEWANRSKKLISAMGNGIREYFHSFIEEDKMLLLRTPDSGNLQNFFHLFPESRVVILIRDGRDTVESFSKSWGGTGAFKKMCDRWSERVEMLLKFTENAKNSGFGDSFLIVRYEDLNVNTESELRKVLEFLDLNQDSYDWEDLANTPILGSSTYKGGADDVHWKPIEKTKDFKPDQKWKDWSSSKKSYFKKSAGENLIRLGFEKDNNW